MTEKKQRFKEIISTQKVIDTVTNKEYDCLLDNDLFDLINGIAEEKDYWKKRALLLEKKYNEGDGIEWLRNNTVWEQMPTDKRTYTTTSNRGKND